MASVTTIGTWIARHDARLDFAHPPATSYKVTRGNMSGSPSLPSRPVVNRAAFGSAAAQLPSVLDAGSIVLTRSARSALLLALRVAGIGDGSGVLVPNYYCPTVPAPIERAGAVPMFYPILRNALPDIAWLKTHVTVSCKAMVAAHFFGLPVPLGHVRDFCDERGIVLIEDCAHSFFGAAGGIPVGSIGDFAIASLPKFFPAMEGGALISRRHLLSDEPLAGPGLVAELKAVWHSLQAAADHGGLGIFGGAVRIVTRSSGTVRGDGHSAGGSDESQKVVADAEVQRSALADHLLEPMRIRRVDRWLVQQSDRRRIVERRRENFLVLAEHCAGAGLAPLFPELPAAAAPYVFPLWAEEPGLVYSEVRRRRLPVLRWDRYWPGAIDARGDVGREWGHHVMQVLCHQDLTTGDLQAVASILVDTARHASRTN